MSRILILCFVALIFSSSAIAADGPKERTEGFVNAMKASKAKDEASYKRIDDFIDYDTITSDTVEPHKKHFNATQLKTFKKDLTHLIRMVAYPQSSTFYAEAKVKYRAPKISGDKATVIQDTFLPSEDLEMEIGYLWQQSGSKWSIVDITFDEDSIVKDYQNQFGRIIAKEGADGLIKRVQNKIKELDK